MSISDLLKTRIIERIKEYSEAPFGPPLHQQVLRELQVFPMLLDLSGGYAIRPDGEVIKFFADGSIKWSIESDQRVRNIALFQGSKLFPEIRELLPSRSANSETCPQCKGTGRVPGLKEAEEVNIICYCGGLGWIPST
jgi:hypothetical protein